MNDFLPYLQHHGILGMKWGVRRYQNEDGSYTAAGRERYLRPNNKDRAKDAYALSKKLNRSGSQSIKNEARAERMLSAIRTDPEVKNFSSNKENAYKSYRNHSVSDTDLTKMAKKKYAQRIGKSFPKKPDGYDKDILENIKQEIDDDLYEKANENVRAYNSKILSKHKDLIKKIANKYMSVPLRNGTVLSYANQISDSVLFEHITKQPYYR